MFRTNDISNFIYTFFGIFVKLKELYKTFLYCTAFVRQEPEILSICFLVQNSSVKINKKHKKYRHMIFG